MATTVRISVAVVALSFLAVITKPVLVRLGVLPDPSRYGVGDHVDVPAHMLGSTRTALVFGRASCAGCQRATPQLLRLNTEIGSRPDVRIWLLTDERNTKWAAASGFPESAVIQTDLTEYRLGGIPTVLVLDGSGIVLKIIEAVSEEGLVTILDAIRH